MLCFGTFSLVQHRPRLSRCKSLCLFTLQSWTDPSPSSSPVTLTFVRSTGQSFCRLSLGLAFAPCWLCVFGMATAAVMWILLRASRQEARGFGLSCFWAMFGFLVKIVSARDFPRWGYYLTLRKWEVTCGKILWSSAISANILCLVHLSGVRG